MILKTYSLRLPKVTLSQSTNDQHVICVFVTFCHKHSTFDAGLWCTPWYVWYILLTRYFFFTFRYSCRQTSRLIRWASSVCILWIWAKTLTVVLSQSFNQSFNSVYPAWVQFGKQETFNWICDILRVGGSLVKEVLSKECT